MTVLFNLENGNVQKVSLCVPTRVKTAKERREVLELFFRLCHDLRVQRDKDNKYVYKIIDGKLP